ncbi:ras-related protein Rab-24-like [Phymastichus coffea]|uniref:ras-related protein Rab-24-like n=1 Tax=Phymastichus coffea TaxID=108790 RepID=UPI00273C84AB|nr:ras-related protein Rab-24-like [Phymastichus coffea]
MSHVDVKVVLLGHEAVGKTSLMQRFVNDRFNENLAYQNTIGSAFASKEIQVGNKKLVLGIWDTAGSERYQAMTKGYYRGAAAALICFDMTDPETFKRAKFWMTELRSVEENCKMYLCATKKDLLDNGTDANPNLEVVERYANGVQSQLFLTSSKTGENVAEIFNTVAEDFISNPLNAKNLGDFITLENNKKISRCCPL